jgi:hypothetical protein
MESNNEGMHGATMRRSISLRANTDIHLLSRGQLREHR